jgi:hypothetical protein
MLTGDSSRKREISRKVSTSYAPLAVTSKEKNREDLHAFLNKFEVTIADDGKTVSGKKNRQVKNIVALSL